MKKIIVISTIFFLFFSCDSKSVNIYEIELPNETIDNKKFNINDYKNKSVLLNFWFPSCPPCVYELEILNEITGFIHLTNNDYEKALPIFQELFDQHHRNTFTVRSLAGIHAKQGRLDIAQKLLQSL